MRKIILILFILSAILISISCVSAHDNINITTNNIDNSLNINNTQIPGTFKDLNKEIQNISSGETYNLTRDYKFENGDRYIPCNKVITITQDNIVINGNGFEIDAGSNQHFAIFNVLGNNITIKNIKFANSQPDGLNGPKINSGNTQFKKISNPITWQGNSGVLFNCTFRNNIAVNGGALHWIGSNGTINKCLFINNTATGVAGAIYIGGVNNTISNSLFINSTSKLSGEAIFVDCNRKKINFVHNIFTNKHPIIDGASLNFDVNYLYYSHMVYAGGNVLTEEEYKINLVPILYSAIINGGVNKYDKNIKYSIQYDNKTHTLTLYIMENNVFTPKNNLMYYSFEYLKAFSFTNMTDLNHVFNSLIHGDYNTSVIQNLIAHVFYEGDYKALSAESFGSWFKADKNANLINKLTIKFERTCTINSDKTWDLKKMGYDAVTILGCGSTINGQAKDRDEKTWVMANTKCQFSAQNLIIKKFNTALYCSQGICYLENIQFRENRMNYLVNRDWGAAILNSGIVFCFNCIFADNYAKNGGAIFSQGFLSLYNTTFSGNKAYGKGNDVCVGNEGKVQINGENITTNTNNIYFAESLSESQVTWSKVVCIGSSFAAGFLVGFITANPIAGIAIGGLIGAGLGAFTACKIAAGTYDMNFNRSASATNIILSSTIAGMLGGVIGYFASGAYGAIEYNVIETASTETSTFIEPEIELFSVSEEVSIISFPSEISSIGEASFIEELSLDGAIIMAPVFI